MVSRINIIASNGGDGEHYKELPLCYGEWDRCAPCLFCPSCKWVGHCKEATTLVYKVYPKNDNMA